MADYEGVDVDEVNWLAVIAAAFAGGVTAGLLGTAVMAVIDRLRR